MRHGRITLICPGGKGRTAHISIDSGLTACMRTIGRDWAPLARQDPFPGLCLDCARRLWHRLEGISTKHAAGRVITMRGLSEPVCPRCGCSRPDDARRRDGEGVRMVCKACAHRWRMVVDFLWDHVIEPKEVKCGEYAKQPKGHAKRGEAHAKRPEGHTKRQDGRADNGENDR